MLSQEHCTPTPQWSRVPTSPTGSRCQWCRSQPAGFRVQTILWKDEWVQIMRSENSTWPQTITRSFSLRVWVQTRPVIRFGADFPLFKIMRFPAFCKIVFVFIFLQGVWWKKSFSWNSFWWHLQDTAWFAGKVLGRAGNNRSLLFVWYCTVCCKVDKKYCTVCCKDRRCLCPDSWQEKVSRSRNASPPREKWRRIA